MQRHVALVLFLAVFPFRVYADSAFQASQWGALPVEAPLEFAVADVNGDKKSDLYYLRKDRLELLEFISTGKKFRSKAYGFSVALSPTTEILAGDFDGDGLLEYLKSDGSGGSVELAERGGEALQFETLRLSEDIRWTHLFLVRSDEDTRDDIVFVNVDTMKVYAALSREDAKGNYFYVYPTYELSPECKYDWKNVHHINPEGGAYRHLIVLARHKKSARNILSFIRGLGEARYAPGRFPGILPVSISLKKETRIRTANLTDDDLLDIVYDGVQQSEVFFALLFANYRMDKGAEMSDQLWTKPLFNRVPSLWDVGDVNSDGLSEIVSWEELDRNFTLVFSLGDRRILRSEATGIPVGSGWEALRVADFDGDGRSDVLIVAKDTKALWVAVSRVAKDILKAHRSESPGPKVCLGYHPSPILREWGDLQTECPKDHAAVAALESSAKEDFFGLATTCCPLPANDVLSDKHLSVRYTCPEDYVVTGSIFEGDTSRIRCTQINRKRYQLGEVREGAYYGVGLSGKSEDKQIVTRGDIPLAIRYGIGRKSSDSWFIDGCVGYPYGALLVGRTGKRCSEQSYRVLQYAGEGDDPKAGTPVTMYPSCRAISDIYNSNGACIE